MVKKYSFKDFLTDHVELINSDNTTSTAKIDRITIPMIQRDYAQGRKYRSGANDEAILNLTGRKFINEIFSTIESADDTKQLELDFVYGSIKTVKEEIAGSAGSITYFNPLDGQQRLTTLYLMYWFIGGIELMADERVALATILKNFYYETRASSTVFCNKLVSELQSANIDFMLRRNATIENNMEIAPKVCITTQIENLSWFHDAYKSDPTVQAMLNMLDVIQQLYIDHNCSNVYGNLERLRFYVLPLSNFELTEDLYVKMNARGKQLTNFENFKADFQHWIKSHIKEYKLDNQEYDGREMPYDIYFINKIDNQWSLCFWKALKDSNDKNYDPLFLSFIYKYFLNEYILHSPSANKGLDKEPDFISLNEEAEYSGFALFERILSQESLENLSVLLDKISEHYDEIIEVSQPCWSDSNVKFDILKSKLTLQERTVFCALIMYLIKKDFNKAALKSWLHVVWNIVENANIDSWRMAAGVIQLIMELVEYSDDIYKSLANESVDIRSSQSKDSISEERRKAKLICENPDWKDTLLQAEKHPFFKGSISFLIPNDDNIDSFKLNLEMAKLLFDANGVTLKYQGTHHILLRALLSKYTSLSDIKYHVTDKKEKENSLKNMLASDPIVRSALAEWISLKTEDDIYSELIKAVAKESSISASENDFEKKLHQLLYKKTDLIDWMQQYGAIRYKDNYVSRPSSSYDWIYVYGYSNEIITELISRGWTCDNKCYIGIEPNRKEIPFYWSAAGREIDVTKAGTNEDQEFVLKCSVGSETIDLSINNNFVKSIKYHELVKRATDVPDFVDEIEKLINNARHSSK